MNAELFSLTAYLAGMLLGLFALAILLLTRKGGRKDKKGDPLANAVLPFLRGRWEASQERDRKRSTSNR